MIIVGIPYIKEDAHLLEDCVTSHKDNAGCNCVVVTSFDLDRVGWPKMHNHIATRYQFDYYCYSAIDYRAGKDYLRRAVSALEYLDRGLFCFNDKKWNGRIATAGVVSRKFYETYGLFHEGYQDHGADDELTEVAKKMGEYVYDPNVMLYEMTERVKGKKHNEQDGKLFKERLKKLKNEDKNENRNQEVDH